MQLPTSLSLQISLPKTHTTRTYRGQTLDKCSDQIHGHDPSLQKHELHSLQQQRNVLSMTSHTTITAEKSYIQTILPFKRNDTDTKTYRKVGRIRQIPQIVEQVCVKIYNFNRQSLSQRRNQKKTDHKITQHLEERQVSASDIIVMTQHQSELNLSRTRQRFKRSNQTVEH
jgi:hypothetical protein